MFRVENADFIADKLASELLPDQEYREAAKNAEEAIRRRLEAEPTSASGRIEYDVDWAMLQATGAWYLSCADNGDGMSRSELERYTTTLAVQGAGRNQSLSGNQGMGLKISGPTRHKAGVLIRSMKNGERTMVQVGWNAATKEYGLIPLGPNGELVVSVPDEKVLLDGDLTRLAQVFSNVLINSAKYTPANGSISLRALREGDQIAVRVKDTGIGIAEEHLGRIFKMFGQVESALNRAQGGQGIGLALARGLVELHGGTIRASSEGLGKGSEFEIRLPAVV